MIPLSKITENTVLESTSHARYPGAHCAFFGVAGMVPLIKNSCALMVGPAVCLYNAKLNIRLRSLTSDPRPDNLLLLLLSQEDIIFGAHDKLQQGVIEADRQYRPEVLFVVTTCTQEIIGEDFDAAIEEIRSQVEAKLLVIHTDMLMYANRILPDDLEDIRLLIAEGIDFNVMKSGDALQSDRLLDEWKPDFFIGHGDRRSLARLKIQSRSLMRAYYTPGFAGTDQVMRLLGQSQKGSDILYYKESMIHDGEKIWL